ncbi:MAG TPA: hypothetical protein VGO92_13635 [Acidimicrobiales bacterium]|jgi:hypothetical protein|nr:hypothetical protein [Acidimicrobiales bacterium]
MSDLSKVLGDLYGGDNEPSATPPRDFRPSAPEWADEERLDEAFAGWTPGPPADAHATEREMAVVVDAPGSPEVPAARLDDDLAATLSAALVDAGQENGQPEVPIATAPAYSLPFEPAPAPVGDASEVDQPPQPPMAETWVDPEPVPPAPVRPWTRADDDILPGKGAGAHTHTKTKLSKAKLPKVKAPKARRPAPAQTTPAAAQPEAGEAEPKKLFGIQLRRK